MVTRYSLLVPVSFQCLVERLPNSIDRRLVRNPSSETCYVFLAFVLFFKVETVFEVILVRFVC